MKIPEAFTKCCRAALAAVLLSSAVALCQTPGKTGPQALTAQEKTAIRDFSNRTKQYLSMEHSLPASRLSPKADIAQLEKQREALRDAVQEARAGAKQGDMFTPEAAPVFRKLLQEAMRGPDGRKIRASLNHAEPLAPQDLVVNKVYPNLRGQPLQSVPPSVLEVLPPLPKGLEYRISDHTLALRDREANIVVDFLPNALP